MGPYEVRKGELVQTFLRHYRNEILGVLFIVCVFLLSHFRIRYLVKKRTTQLSEAYRKSRLIEAKYHKMQKVGIVGLLSGTVAHEIRQPLGAIQFFAKGLENNLRKLGEDTDPNNFLPMARQIIEEAQKADETIKRIRRLAAEGQSIQEIDVSSEIKKLTQEALHASGISKCADVKIQAEGLCIFRGDLVCFDLVFSNLLRNACEYIAAEKLPKIEISVSKENGSHRY